MSILKSTTDIKSDVYKQNYQKNKALAAELKGRIKSGTDQGRDKSIQKHRQRGKMMVRERIRKIIDRGSPFLELSPLAAFDQYDNSFPGAGIVTGIGIIHGRQVVIIANDPTVKGGTYIKETIRKHLRALEIGLENHLPCVYIVESGGIFLPEQAQLFADRENFGRIFYYQARLSAKSIPQIALVMGSCTAGGAYIPAMSDEVVMVKDQAALFLGGPSLVYAATGETVTAEELGGAMVHTTISGVADYLAEDEIQAIEIVRNIFAGLPAQTPHTLHSEDIEDPIYPADELYGIISADYRKLINAYEVIMRLVDGSRFEEFKAGYGQSLVTGYARIQGFPVGILANNGILFSESALKGTHFIELCIHRKIPMVFLQNISGFMVGKEYEHKGIAKDGAKMVLAVANANVPKFTVIFGSSHGAGNYAMAGRAFNPALLFMWPNARISVMNGKYASEVLTSIKRNSGNGSPANAGRQKLTAGSLEKRFEEESSAYYSTSRLWDDGIIDPVDTRKALGMGIAMSRNRPVTEPRVGVFRM